MTRPLVHIGYHRTASTWLKRHLFAAPGWFLAAGKDEVMELIVLPGPFSFDAPACRAWIAKAFTAAPASSVPVLSSEMLCGRVFSGGLDAKELAGRIAAAVDAPRILIVIREQRAAIISIYRAYLQSGGGVRLADYLDPPAKNRESVLAFSLEHFRYAPLVAHYVAEFGRENVLVLPFEQFVADGAAFVARIAAFGGAPCSPDLPFTRPENQGAPAGLLEFSRCINLLTTRTAVNGYSNLYVPGGGRFAAAIEKLPVWRNGRVERGWRKLVDDRTRGLYDQDNRALAALMGEDLAGLGYHCGSAAPHAPRPAASP